MAHSKFSAEEDALLLKYRNAGMPYVAISEKLAVRGYSRTAATIRVRYEMLREKQRKAEKSGGAGNGLRGAVTECDQDNS